MLICLKSFLKIFFLLLFISLNNHPLFSQTYNIKKYSVEDGLPQSQVLSLCQDNSGNIWMGTNRGGVAKFNGNSFENFTEIDGLTDNLVYSISPLKNGDLIFCTNGGLSIFNHSKFINYSVKNGLSNNRVYTAIENSKKEVLIGTEKGLCILKNKVISNLKVDTTIDNSSITTIHIQNENIIWIGTANSGAFKWDRRNNSVLCFSTKTGLMNNCVWSINEDLNGNIFVGTSFGANIINNNNQINIINIPYISNYGFNSIVRDKEGNMWMGTSNGLFKYKNGKYEKYFYSNGLPSDFILSLIEDREGNIWAGTYGYGVCRFSSEEIKSYSSKDFLSGDYIDCLFQDSKNNLWFGIEDNGATKICSDKTVIKYNHSNDNEKSLIYDQIQAFCEDDNGNIFLGSRNGLSIFNGEQFFNYPITNDSSSIYSLLKSFDGSVWIGTKNGLFKYNDKKINSTKLNTSNIFQGEEIPIYSIVEDSSKTLWLATETGVIKYTGNSALLFNEKNGFTNKRTLSIVKDKNNNLWFGTDNGVYFYNHRQFKKIDVTNGLASNKVYLLLIDNNYLWVGTNKGLDRIDLLNYYSNQNITIKHYGKEEGFTGIECNRNAALKDHEGNLWFGTVKGAFVINPKFEKTNLQEPITRITGLRLFFENADKEIKSYSEKIDSLNNLPVNLQLPYNKNHITFDFIGICMTIPNKVKYQFKLEGADNKWSPATSKTEATYSSLPPGDYTFYLKAMNNDGLWNTEPVSFKFTILPPWWQTWWFYSICGVLLFVSIYFFINIRTKNLQKAKIKLEAEVKTRTNQLLEEKEKVETINKEVISQKAIIEAKNQDITDSIKYAKNIQEAILPPLENLYKEFKDVFIFYQPKDIVSGDFYWFQKRNNKKLIAAVDCTGHGVPGAFMSIVGNTLLNEIVNEKNIVQPAQILNELHKGIKEALKQNQNHHERQDGMDIALCSINEENNELEFAGANRPLWIFRNNHSSENIFEPLKADKYPIGGIEIDNKRIYTNYKVPVQKGDVIYMFSDGFADQFGGIKGKKFMVGNLQKKLMEIHHLQMNEQEKILKETFFNWKGGLEQVDDILVIAFRI